VRVKSKTFMLHRVNSSKEQSVLVSACFLWLREGNDYPHRMDYQGRCHPLPILYTLRPEGIRCYFADNVVRAVHIGVNVSVPDAR
jgi:hypothetical protein